MRQKTYLICLLIFTSAAAQAEDTLQAVLNRMKADNATSLAYTEKRTLKMLTSEWQGSGFLYAAPPHTLLKEQRRPELEIMASAGKQAFYFHPNNNQRYQADLDETQPQVVVFNELLHGNLAALEKLYQVDFKQNPKNWRITLVAKNTAADSKAAKILVQGLPEQPADLITVIQADGDRSEFSLTPVAKGEGVQKNINKLLKQIQGQP